MSDHLDRYARQRWITAAQYTAGVMFARDAKLARLHLRRPPGARADPDEAAAAARFKAVCEQLGQLRRPLIAVLVHEVGATSWAEREGMRHGDGMTILKTALNQLVTIYSKELAA